MVYYHPDTTGLNRKEWISLHENFPHFSVNTKLTAQDGRSWRLLRLLGSGSFGMVIEAESVQDSTLHIAFKVGCLFYGTQHLPTNSRIALSNELSVTYHVHSAHIVKTIPETFFTMPIKGSDLSCSMLGFELLSHNLLTLINDQTATLSSLINIAKQLLTGMCAIHSAPHSFIHRDIKPENIMFSKDGILKLIDFGSVFKPPFLPTDTGKKWCARAYRAPELFRRLPSHFSTKLDMWSVGCVFAQLLTGKIIFCGMSFKDISRKMMIICGEFPDYMCGDSPHRKKAFYPEKVTHKPYWLHDNALPRFTAVPDERLHLFISLTLGCLKLDPEQRYSAQEALDLLERGLPLL